MNNNIYFSRSGTRGDLPDISSQSTILSETLFPRPDQVRAFFFGAMPLLREGMMLSGIMPLNETGRQWP